MEAEYNTSRKNKNGYYRFSFYCKLENGVVLDHTQTILISVPTNISGNFVVPNGITIILENAFTGCEFINNIHLPESVKAIGNQCFKDCIRLNTLTLPKSIEYIAPQCFLYSSVISVLFEGTKFISFKNGIYSREKELIALFGSFRKYVLPSSLRSIQAGVFSKMYSLEEIDLTACQDINIFKEGMFSHCKSLSKVKLPQNITTIPKGFFDGCYSLDIELSDYKNLVRIEENAFRNTSLFLTKLPESLQFIGEYAFYGCAFIDISIPKSVKFIGRWAFAHCQDLLTIRIKGENTAIGSCVFDQSLRLRNVVINDSLNLGANVPKRWGFELSKSLTITLESQFEG